MTIDITGTEAEAEIAYAAILESLDRLQVERIVRMVVGDKATIHATLHNPVARGVTPR